LSLGNIWGYLNEVFAECLKGLPDFLTING
jgi:hypothetical protein